MSQWVIVVEFIGNVDGVPQCLGEAIFDSTSNPKNPWIHALRLGTSVTLVKSNGELKNESCRTMYMDPASAALALS